MTTETPAPPTVAPSRKSVKAERRKKQREANPARALKMHQARLAGTPGKEALPELSVHPPSLNIGCSGWFYWDWKGKYYPQDVGTKDWFAHYAHDFSTVELNAPFYSWPTVAAVKTWLRQAGGRDDFVYTVKVSELVTHVKRFTGTKTLIRDFGYIADLLGPLMGCFLFQLPPDFDFTPARLRNILSQLEPERRNVVEFRHASWWNDRVYDAFRDAGAIFCSCSAPKLPENIVSTGGEIYVRFHGPLKWYRHNYSDEDLQLWSRKIHEVEPGRVWAYFNNDYDTYAIHNALQLRTLLSHPA